MRSLNKDQNGLVTFGGRFYGPTGGIQSQVQEPFSVTRTGVGVYVIRFDLKLVPLTIIAATDIGPYVIYNIVPGAFNMNTVGVNGTAADASFASFTVTARKVGG